LALKTRGAEFPQFLKSVSLNTCNFKKLAGSQESREGRVPAPKKTTQHRAPWRYSIEAAV